MSYDAKSIIKMSEIDHLRNNPGMYIGDTTTPTRLIEECLDNCLDEIQAGEGDKIAIIIDNKEGFFQVLDNGRGIPFNQKLDIKSDPPILICTSLFTSGKFKKNDSDSGYKFSIGLHGVGLSAVYALSEKMVIDIYRDKKHGEYVFTHDGTINRSEEKSKGDKPFSTRMTVFPSNKYFDSLEFDLKRLEERLRIACANYSGLHAILMVDGKAKLIKGTEEDLVRDYLSKSIEKWIKIEEKNNKGESYKIVLGWDIDAKTTQSKYLSAVNLVITEEGAHLNLLNNGIKNVLNKLADKNKFEFQPNDSLNWLRAYINLKIIKTSFEAQVKTKLSKNSDLSVMEKFENKLEQYFKSNPDYLNELLDAFQSYRKEIENKKVLKNSAGKSKRGSNAFTNLRDCSEPNGELFITEGQSACGGLVETRDPKKHAILPLRGVTPNAVKKSVKDLLKNKEMTGLIQTLGCGINPHCNISNLRYSKIIIMSDADPAGDFIASHLVVFFAMMMPEVIKNGRLYICETPLYGIGHYEKFLPLWTKEDVQIARDRDEKIRRIKGLGEFNPKELKIFAFESKRRLIRVPWVENEKEMNSIFRLFSKSEERKKLAMGEWILEK